MTVEEAIYSVKNMSARGIPSVSDSLRPREVFSSINRALSYIIKEELRSKMYIPSDWMYYPLNCIELIDAPITECECVNTKCTVKRSKYKLPTPLILFGNIFIKNVTNIEGNLSIDIVNISSVKYRDSNQFLVDKPFVYLNNNYIYIGNYNFELITAQIIPSNLTEVIEFNSFCNKNKRNSSSSGCGDIFTQSIKYDETYMHQAIEIASSKLISRHSRQEQDRVPNQSNII